MNTTFSDDEFPQQAARFSRRWWFSVLCFPLLMTVTLSACYLGFAYGLHESLAIFGSVIGGMVFVALAERLQPYRRRWNENHGDVKTDVINLFVTQAAIPRLLGPVWLALLAPIVAGLANRYGAEGVWPQHWPLIAQLALVLIIAEFGRYWVHRWAHRFGPLWRFHAVHHSPKRLYWLNAARFHPVEKVFFLIPEVVPFIILGANIEVMSLYFVFNGMHGLFQHSNIQLRLGPLNYIFSMTELHRWHHSQIIAESDKNFGNNLIIWDIVFGTFYWPKDRHVARIGLLNPHYPSGYLAQIKAGFNRNRVDKPSDYTTRQQHYQQAVRQQAQAYDQQCAKSRSSS